MLCKTSNPSSNEVQTLKVSRHIRKVKILYGTRAKSWSLMVRSRGAYTASLAHCFVPDAFLPCELGTPLWSDQNYELTLVRGLVAPDHRAREPLHALLHLVLDLGEGLG